jgi:O-antigen ligase
MQPDLNLVVLIAGGVLAGLLAAAGMAGALHLTAGREHGYMHLIFYALLLTTAGACVLSARDLTSNFLLPEAPVDTTRHPFMAATQPLVSLLLLAVSGERIITAWLQRRQRPTPSVMLPAFMLFWLGTVASPALLGANPLLTHDYAYPLVIGIGAALASRREQDMALEATRNGLLLFMLIGLLLIPVQPRLVLDSAYGQGFLPGLPRFAGLAAHAVSMGLLAQLGLLCLQARPFSRRWLNRLAWAVGLTVLLLAQSKTAWMAFIACSACLVLTQRGPLWWRRLNNPLQPGPVMAVLVAAMMGVAALAGVLMFGDIGYQIDRFLNSAEGAQLASMTGRDRIWAIAWDEWQRNPLFGYGPDLWGDAFRAAIGMSNATHAHNQFMDTLSRAGLVGAVTLLVYSALLLALSLHYMRVTGGLSLALLVALLLRSISEVPLLLFGYNIELIIHALLLMTLAAAAQEARAAVTQHVPADPGRQRPDASPNAPLSSGWPVRRSNP